jgi:hypothetical protein
VNSRAIINEKMNDNKAIAARCALGSNRFVDIAVTCTNNKMKQKPILSICKQTFDTASQKLGFAFYEQEKLGSSF